MNLEKLKAYELVEEKDLKDLNSKGYLFRHKKSGARISAISNDDENKVFYIGFRTPPADSTGVAHIVEHTVLCGSDKFPAKDPFVELVKGSLNTFLNAMTYPDKTVYPVASCNDKDFQNLMDVYMDAVLHPNIYKREEIFKQEGWHYELESKDAPVTINGVVYNEMKGAFSSPEGVLEREILNSLYPDTSYGNESGGDPQFIPDLTYQDYLDFHSRYYHPCNSYIYLYGNVDNTYLSYNLSIGTSTDRKLYQAFEILDYALLNAPAAPLKKALILAGIGKDIMGSFDNGVYQPMFSIIAKNANLKDKDRFLEIIQSVLREQAEGGLNKKSLLAGINSAEFRYRESDFGSYPKGLIYGLQMFDSWLYDDSIPFMHLEAGEIFQFLRKQVETDYFEKLIQDYMIDNTHASVVVIEPERGLNARNEEKLTEKLKSYKESLSEDEIEKLIRDTKHLKAYQEEPSSREDIEKIPMLKREDMKKEAMPFVNEERNCENLPVLYHNIFSNGILYLNFLFDICFVSQEDLPYLGILKAVLGYMDTKQYSYGDLADEINLETGGMSASISVYPSIADDTSYEAKFEVRTKMLNDKLPKALDLLEEI